MKPTLGIYIHIPFCKSKCHYCDFKSYTCKQDHDNNAIEAYVNALLSEITLYEDIITAHDITSIYIGGGTPSVIDARRIQAILKALPSAKEITLEVNPNTVDDKSICIYKESGVNRISIGLQTIHDKSLKAIGRSHTYCDFLKTYELFRKHGFKNISVDLIFALPNESITHVEESIAEIIRLDPEHVSIYSLKIEEGTAFFTMLEKGLIQPIDESVERDMYHRITNALEAKGYPQYELSNFSKPSFESRHNLIYWNNSDYLGLGLSSHGKINHSRYANHSTMEEYLSAIYQGQKPICESTALNDEDTLFESIMLGLRLNRGLYIPEINQTYGIDFEARYQEAIQKNLTEGLIHIYENTLRLTPLGRDVANRVFVSFL